MISTEVLLLPPANWVIAAATLKDLLPVCLIGLSALEAN